MRYKKWLVSLMAVALILPGLSYADEFSILQQQLLFLIQQVTRLQGELNALNQIRNVACKTLTRNLQIGSSGEDVVFLQGILEKEGFNVGTERSQQVYGQVTASAVSGYQQKYKDEILKPLGLEYGTGVAGTATRAKMNSVYGCGALAPDLSKNPTIVAPQHITVSSPKANQLVSSSVKVVGQVQSSGWATGKGEPGTVAAYDSTGRKLGQATLSAKSDKALLPLAFEGTLSITGARTDGGVLLFSSLSTTTVLSTTSKQFRVPVKFMNVSPGAIHISFPTANMQLVANQSYIFTWQGGGSKVDLLLIDRGLEDSGGVNPVAWRVDDIPNGGSYTFTPPSSLRGSYRLHVTDGSSKWGTSDFFTIGLSGPSSGGPNMVPRISTVIGPDTLSVNQSGQWTVAAYDPENSKLTFAVDWGDGTSGSPGVSSVGAGTETAIFNHIYKVNGTRIAVFRVTDGQGLTEQRAFEVIVGSASAPTITNISPSAGPFGTTVTITGTRFTSNNTIHFGAGQLTNIPSTNTGKTIKFNILQDQTGTYNVSVQNSNGVSNTETFTVMPPPSCDASAGTNQFRGCFYRWRNSTMPNSGDDGIVAGETTPQAPGFVSPVPTTATALDINWGESAPNATVGQNEFAARWRGNFTFDPGTYHFTGGSDDGIRVRFDGVTKLDKWIFRGYTEDSFDVTFPVRTTVLIDLDFMEAILSARVKFGWTRL